MICVLQLKANPAYTMERFIVWTVNMTVWSLTLQCFALLEQDGPCHIDVPVIVYSEFLILSF